MSSSLSLRALLIFFSLVSTSAILYVSSLSFNISSFDTNPSDMLYEGFAKVVHRSVDLTGGKSPPFFAVGRVQYSKPIDLWDSVTGRQADFFTHFSLTIDTYNATSYSDGVAFFLAPAGFAIPPNSGGGFLGLFNDSTVHDGPRNQIVMVEFDTLVNPMFDPPQQHIGINENTLGPPLVHAIWNAGSHSGRATDVIVTYNSTSKNLSVFWSFDDKPVYPDDKSPSLSCRIDLAKVLPESVAIGFSASFGFAPERHSINSWEFTSNLDVARPRSAGTSSKGVNSKMCRAITFIAVPVACLLLVVSAGSCLFMIKMRKNCESRALTHFDKEI